MVASPQAPYIGGGLPGGRREALPVVPQMRHLLTLFAALMALAVAGYLGLRLLGGG